MSDEAMINNIVRTRKDRREAQKVDNEARLKQLFATVPLVNKELVDTVNREVLEVFTNQHLLDAEAKEVSSQAERFKKLSHEWFGLFEKFNLSLKELGDMSNWATVIETDARETVRALDDMTRAQKSLRALEGS